MNIRSLRCPPEQFAAIARHLLLVYCLVSACSIALSQIAVLSMTLLWVFSRLRERSAWAEIPKQTLLGEYLPPMLGWLGFAAISSVLGVAFSASFSELAKTCVYSLLPLCVWDIFRAHSRFKHAPGELIAECLLVFLLSQSIAGSHSILSAALGYEVKPKVPGPVTESGQIVLTLGAATGLWAALRQKDANVQRKAAAVTLIMVPLFLCTAWFRHLGNFSDLSQTASTALGLGGLLIAVGTAGYSLYKGLAAVRKNERLLLSSPALLYLLAPLLGVVIAAFVLNLKRSPWMGSALGLLLLGLLIWKSLARGVVGLTVLSLCFPQVRERLSSFFEHFFIHGGRFDMWSLGLELVQRFPLGIGLGNSEFMRRLDSSLPILHRHMHNNFLNIAVETGWLGLATYIWWIGTVILLGLSVWRKERHYVSVSSNRKDNQRSILALALSLALLSWQISGMVEYNFGDGEIRMIAFTFIGFILALASKDFSREEEH